MSSSPIGDLTSAERQILLRLARSSVEAAASRFSLPQVQQSELSQALKRPGACFVTLYERAELRGCTGVLAARQPLANEVVQTAAQTALYDPRFAPVTPSELPYLDIEISVLTPPHKLAVPTPDSLPTLIRPHIDGVTLYRGSYRATFLPQVWSKIPEPTEFLNRLSEKMGLSAKAWRQPGMEVEVYQVEEFSEKELAGR